MGSFARLPVLRLPPVMHSVWEKLPALAAWILALLLVAGTFAAGRSPAPDRPPSGDPSIIWRA